MERRDKLVLFLLLCGAGYAGYKNWDVIADRLGLDDIAPGKVKAIDLAKQSFTFEQFRPNGMVLAQKLRGGEVEPIGDIWEANRNGGDKFIVVCRYTEKGQPQIYRWDVDLATGGVTLLDQAGQPPR